MPCSCGHPAHHHANGYCFTVTVTGPATEDHEARTETICDCLLFVTQDEVDMANDASDW